MENRMNLYPLKLPKIFEETTCITFEELEGAYAKHHQDELRRLFPNTFGQPLLKARREDAPAASLMRVGVVFSGGQASGGHNVIAGLFDSLKKIDAKAELFGFLGGPSGILEEAYLKLTDEIIEKYRNTGGFDLIGSGRTKIESPEQLKLALTTVKKLELDGLVIIGGDDSNTNAAVLAEYFLSHQAKTRVIGVPKTIDGDLKSEFIESSFGFDTACKTFSHLIGNICRDALSAKKYYHFIRLMGRSASHVTLECALQTHVNKALLTEEISKYNHSLEDIVNDLVQMVRGRSVEGKNYGVVLIPEGLLEFIPEFKDLIEQLNALLAENQKHLALIEAMQTIKEKQTYLQNYLSNAAFECFAAIPETIQEQLLNDRDPHGNVRVSQIDTEQLLMLAVSEKLTKENFKGPFSPLPHFMGYEGRAAWPSFFDAQYCYGLGFVAAQLLASGKTGYMACLRRLVDSVENWEVYALPITMLMNIEMRHGKAKPVIKKALVDLEGPVFSEFTSQREKWILEDQYQFPLPIQFGGHAEFVQSRSKTLQLESEGLLSNQT